jgi:outer membrane protein OmpA-like peptidoglycan-associated protein
MRTRLGIATLLLGLAVPAAVRAESGFLNIHLEPGLALPAGGYLKEVYGTQANAFGYGGGLGIDIQPFSPIGFQLRYSVAVFPQPEGSEDGGYWDHGITGGVRWRILDNREGYQFSGGDIMGNLWVDGNVGYHNFYNSGTLGIDAGAGYEASVIEPLQIGVFGRLYFVPDLGAENVPAPPGEEDLVDESAASIYFIAGLSFSLALLGEPEALDTDGDGLSDERESNAHNTDPRNPDTDGDGLSDGVEVTSGRTEARNPDTDGDGVPDGTEDEDHNGSREPTETDGTNRDTDGGGVPDGWERDNDKNGLVASDDDSDGDRVLENVDQCQGTARGTEVDARGCAILRPTLVLRGVNFATDSAEIQSSSFGVLDGVARILADNPDVRIEISGHTDNTGGRAHNVSLSQARAESVKNYMVSRGIDAARLDARGYGMARPSGTNDTEEGRAQNRRIEFTRLDQQP